MKLRKQGISFLAFR